MIRVPKANNPHILSWPRRLNFGHQEAITLRYTFVIQELNNCSETPSVMLPGAASKPPGNSLRVYLGKGGISSRV